MNAITNDITARINNTERISIMKRLIIIIALLGFGLAALPTTAEADMSFGIWVGRDYDGCDCYWGEPDPWDPWWECACYWRIWLWCQHHPYWMWPSWCRRWVEYHYSPRGHYYYVYYDSYRPGCRRVYVHDRYRYRYAVELDRSYSRTERIPRRSGLERPVPEPVERHLASRGPEYRIKTVAAHAEDRGVQTSLRNRTAESSPEVRSRRSPEAESPGPGVSYRNNSPALDYTGGETSTSLRMRPEADSEPEISDYSRPAEVEKPVAEPKSYRSSSSKKSESRNSSSYEKPKSRKSESSSATAKSKSSSRSGSSRSTSYRRSKGSSSSGSSSSSRRTSGNSSRRERSR